MSNSSLPLADVLGHEATDKRIDILRQIGQGGSISQAARAVGVSYKAAWQALETLTNLAGVPLVEKVVGGTGGGGAALTPAGQRVLQAAHALAWCVSEMERRYRLLSHLGVRNLAAYNQKLSQRRADAVKTFLAEHGVPAARIHAEGKGQADPVVNCPNPSAKGEIKTFKQLIECLQPNRRAVIEVKGTRNK